MNKCMLLAVFAMSLAVISQVNATSATSEKIGLTTGVGDKTMAMELREKLNVYKYFSAKFKQKIIDNKGQEIQQASGLVSMAQPNKFRWVTHAPDESLIVSDGTSVWIYNPFMEQVSAMDLNNALAQSPLWLMANQTNEAWDKFLIEKLSSANAQQAYVIKPKDHNNLTRQIIIYFEQDIISHLIIEDAQGQNSHFTFDEFDYKTTVDPADFNFVMPAHVDFDDQREVHQRQ